MRSGFSIIRNGDTLGYPYLESLQSLAPLVDEIVLAHGDSSDSTLQSLEHLRSQLSCPLKILNSPWDPSSLRGGLELSRQTNIALEKCQNDICLYIQGDEVFSDDNTQEILQDLDRFEAEQELDALAFSWVHFYGSYETEVRSAKWYRREIRAIKKSRNLKSFGDAQGFRTWNPHSQKWTKPRTALSRGQVFHYGWVRTPQAMAAKASDFDKLWHEGKSPFDRNPNSIFSDQFGIRKFEGKHPSVMKDRIQKAFFSQKPLHELSNPPKNLKFLRLASSEILESAFDYRPGEFKNYSSLKKF